VRHQPGVAALAHRGPSDVVVERERELAIVGEALGEAAHGRSALVVIEGPAGIGKTRLLAEGRHFAHATGARVLVARAGELEGELAFGVVRQLFAHAGGADDLESVGSTAAAASEVLSGPPPGADDPASRDVSFAMLHSLYGLTVTLAAESSLVIAVDDRHWCDEPSLRFLNYLVRRLEGLAVVVLCTVRPRDRQARGPLVGEIVGDPLARSARPKPLSNEATARLVSEGLGERADGTFSTACHTATDGNPLLLRELISTLQIEGVTPDRGHVSGGPSDRL
jgi:predicted ATPase